MRVCVGFVDVAVCMVGDVSVDCIAVVFCVSVLLLVSVCVVMLLV